LCIKLVSIKEVHWYNRIFRLRCKYISGNAQRRLFYSVIEIISKLRLGNLDTGLQSAVTSLKFKKIFLEKISKDFPITKETNEVIVSRVAQSV